MLAPSRAKLRELDPPRRVVEGAPNGTTGDDEPGVGEPAGGSATDCCLDHINPPLCKHEDRMELRVGGSSVYSLYSFVACGSNEEKVPVCALRKLTEGTGGFRTGDDSISEVPIVAEGV